MLFNICVHTEKQIKKQKLCAVHFGDRISLLCMYFLKMILIVAIRIPIWLLHPHFLPELALLCSFLYTISPSEQLSRIANAGRSVYRQCIFCFISKYWGVHLHVFSVPLSAATTQEGFELCFSQAHMKEFTQCSFAPWAKHGLLCAGKKKISLFSGDVISWVEMRVLTKHLSPVPWGNQQ